MGDNYVIYHLHTMLSNGVTNIDSVTNYQDYIDYASSLGMKAIAFSEHGSVFEWLKKKEAVEKAGMKYIHAEEFYITETLNEKIRDNYHCVLIARNYDGVLELNKLSSKSFNREDGHYYYAPRIAFEELINTSDNIIVCTACLASILASDNEKLKEQFIAFLTLNKHRCFLEIQHHNVEAQKNYNIALWKLSEELDIPLITGTDTHALNEDHLMGRSILQKSKNIHFDNEDGWNLVMMNEDELDHAYEIQNALPQKVYRKAIDNTNVMADMIEEFEMDRSYKYPHLWENPEQLLKEKINQGILDKGINQYPNYQEYVDRIYYELEAYKHNEAIDFMLLMEDVISWCKSQGIQTGYGRGSVNGSVIAWIIGITEMDSIKFGLNFERFMNVERVSLSDIDTDFPPSRIDEVKQYVFNHHGLYCSDIITFNTIADKGAIRDVGRALGIDLDTVGKICDSVDNEEKYAESREKYPELFKYVDLVKGVVVSIGNHPCLLAGEKVLTSDGYKNIEDVTTNDEVYTHKDRYKKVNECMVNTKDRWFEINSYGALPIKCTDNHPFYIRHKIKKQYYNQLGDNYGEPIWEQAQYIDKGDALAIPVNQECIIPNFDNIKLPFDSKDFWWIIGRYLGDGYTIETRRGENWNQITVNICHGFNDASAKYIYEKLDKCNVSYRTRNTRTAKEIIFNADSTKQWYPYLKRFGKHANHKKIPNEVLSLPIDLLRSFIEGYVSADGYVSDNRVEISTSSIDVALAISKCINKVYHIQCNFKIIKAKDNIIEGRTIHTKTNYVIGYTPNPTNNFCFYDGKYIWTYVKSVVIHNEEIKTYNLSVYDDNSYTVNNVAVHNCGMIVSPYPIDDAVGLCTTATDPFPISQLYMKEVDSLNYVKLDLLKLDTIELLSETCKMADIPMILPDNMNINDDKVWDSMRDDTTSCFQWESATGQDYINKLLSKNTIAKYKEAGLNIDKMTLLSIGNSAIRPAGASYRDDLASGVVRKTGSKPIDDFLSNTFGYLVFQCQIIEFLNQYCGFTMGEADIVRRGFAKKTGTDQFIPVIKNGGYLNGNENHYIDGYIKTMKDKYGISEDKSEEDIVAFIKVIEDASSYLFSLNHSQPYSFMGYACAYLRYYYPTEFITCCLNINKDNSDKTTAVTEYAKKVGIQIVPIKFGYSRADYSCDAANKKVYKGVASVKNLNDTVSEELYGLSQSRTYDNFIDLLIDITGKTSCNSRQLDILIKLDYFSAFGEINELTYKANKFANLYDKNKGFKKNIKQAKLGLDPEFVMPYCNEYKSETVKEVNISAIEVSLIDNNQERLDEFYDILEECMKHKKDGTPNGYNYEKFFKLTNMPEDVKRKYATKISEAEYKDLNAYKLLTELQYNGNICSVKEQIKYQQEYLSYIDYIDPDLDPRYIIVTQLNTNYSPKFVAYCIKTGQTCPIKVRKNKSGKHTYARMNTYKDTPFVDGDLLYMIKAKQEPKAKFVDGNWIRDYSDKEWWLYEYAVCDEIVKGTN